MPELCLLELSKCFLDPFGNRRMSSTDLSADISVDTLLGESNAGSLVWPRAAVELPFDATTDPSATLVVVVLSGAAVVVEDDGTGKSAAQKALEGAWLQSPNGPVFGATSAASAEMRAAASQHDAARTAPLRDLSVRTTTACDLGAISAQAHFIFTDLSYGSFDAADMRDAVFEQVSRSPCELRARVAPPVDRLMIA